MARGNAFSPTASRDSYKDILIFEERLKQNAERLQAQKRKYEGQSSSAAASETTTRKSGLRTMDSREHGLTDVLLPHTAFLVSLVLLIIYLNYKVFIQPSIYSLVHYGNVTSLLVSLVTLALFFATGMYSEKIAYAYKFVPQANRALRPFNIYLNTRTQSRFSLSRIFRSSPTTSTSHPPSHPPNSTSSSNSDQPPSLPLSRRTSSSSSHSSSSIRSSRGNRSPPGSPISRSPPPPPLATRGVPLAPIPPASNPRGELIFSSRVSAVFREGYERYRDAWERRRDESMSGGGAGGGKKYWFFSKARSSKPATAGRNEESDRDGTPEGDSHSRREREKRGRSASISSSSKGASRQSSPLRLPAARMSRRNSGASPSSTTSNSTSSSPPSRMGSPESLNGRLGVTGGKEAEGKGRTESFSTFLKTMDENPGVRSGG